jgi:hypothetical protein
MNIRPTGIFLDNAFHRGIIIVMHICARVRRRYWRNSNSAFAGQSIAFEVQGKELA